MALGTVDRAELARRLEELCRQPLPKAVLQASHGPVYLVGGGVRDLVLGRPLKDLDLVVSQDPAETAGRAARSLDSRAAVIGRPPLSVFRISHQGRLADLCPLAGPDIEADLKRRDLTVNAMAIRLTEPAQTPRIIDPGGAIDDLKARRARFVSEENVVADPLRLLRLFRVSAELGLAPDRDSLDLVRKHALLISKSAGERIRDELFALLLSPAAHGFLTVMMDKGLLPAIFPELGPLQGCSQSPPHHLDVLGHTFEALRSLEGMLASRDFFGTRRRAEALDWLGRGANTAILKLALLLHDVGKPPTRSQDENGRIHFFGHDKVGAEMVGQVSERLKLSTEESRLLYFLVRQHLRPLYLFEEERLGVLGDKPVLRLRRLAGDDLWGLLLHSLADIAATRGRERGDKGGFNEFLDFLEAFLKKADKQAQKIRENPLPVTGRDLMEELDLEPSPLIGRLLAMIEEQVVVQGKLNREQALDLAREQVMSGSNLKQ